jgi:predicted Zn-dependent protease
LPDGQAFPGGALVFTTALLDEPDEATVAGVVAHELAHLDRGHMYDVVRRSKLAETQFASLSAGNASFDQLFTRQAALLGMMIRPFRPEQEHEADCRSATWLFEEGYDPRALADFFERLNQRRNDSPDLPFLSFARTHPYSLERRDHVRARLNQLMRWRPHKDLGRFPANLRRLTPREPAAEQR